MTEPKEVITDEKRVLVVIFHAPVPIKYEKGKVAEVRPVQPTEYTVGDLPADIRDTLLEAEANAKKAKAYDAMIEFLKSEHDLPPDELLLYSPLAMIDKMSELMKEKP